MTIVRHGVPSRNTPDPRRCLDCNRPMVAQGHTAPEGWVQFSARGLCAADYSRARRRGLLADYPRQQRECAEVLEEYTHLTEQGYDLAEVARALGMTTGGVQMALQRARQAA